MAVPKVKEPRLKVKEAVPKVKEAVQKKNNLSYSRNIKNRALTKVVPEPSVNPFSEGPDDNLIFKPKKRAPKKVASEDGSKGFFGFLKKGGLSAKPVSKDGAETEVSKMVVEKESMVSRRYPIFTRTHIYKTLTWTLNFKTWIN